MTAMALQVAGSIMVSVGAWLLAPAAGLVVGGVCLLAFGLAVERKA